MMKKNNSRYGIKKKKKEDCFIFVSSRYNDTIFEIEICLNPNHQCQEFIRNGSYLSYSSVDIGIGMGFS